MEVEGVGRGDSAYGADRAYRADRAKFGKVK